MTDDQNVSNQICKNLNGSSSSNCLSKNQIENLLAQKNELTNKNTRPI